MSTTNPESTNPDFFTKQFCSITGDPCLMGISLLQIFETFQKNLAYVFFEPIYFITAIFWLFWGQAIAQVK